MLELFTRDTHPVQQSAHVLLNAAHAHALRHLSTHHTVHLRVAHRTTERRGVGMRHIVWGSGAIAGHHGVARIHHVRKRRRHWTHAHIAHVHHVHGTVHLVGWRCGRC